MKRQPSWPMYHHLTAALLLAALLLLSACGREAAEDSPPPSVEPSPTQTAEMPSPEVSEPETPTPEELLAQQTIDDTHDAFLVPTGGKLDTLLVTVEKEPVAGDEWTNLLQFSVWDPTHMDEPIQRMEGGMYDYPFHGYHTEDANFDGYADFSYTYMLGAKAGWARLWLWDEEAGQFIEAPEYAEIPNPYIDPETQTIWSTCSFSAVNGEETFYRWENGTLVCFRKVEYTYPDENFNQEKIVYERINGELVEISRETHQMLG